MSVVMAVLGFWLVVVGWIVFCLWLAERDRLKAIRLAAEARRAALERMPRPTEYKEIRERLRAELDEFGWLEWTRRDIARRKLGWPGVYEQDWQQWSSGRNAP